MYGSGVGFCRSGGSTAGKGVKWWIHCAHSAVAPPLWRLAFRCAQRVGPSLRSALTGARTETLPCEIAFSCLPTAPQKNNNVGEG